MRYGVFVALFVTGCDGTESDSSEIVSAVEFLDYDGDGVNDVGFDNCPNDRNADQADTDQDGIGDACDEDADNDGFVTCGDDVVFDPATSTCEPLAADTNDSQNPDASEICNEADDDLDGVVDDGVCDEDGDGVADEDDNCPRRANADQADLDADDIGDACDSDRDGDGVGSPANTPDDLDADGFTPEDGDCNDWNRDVNPAADEVCGNRLDENCDGEVDDGCAAAEGEGEGEGAAGEGEGEGEGAAGEGEGEGEGEGGEGEGEGEGAVAGEGEGEGEGEGQAAAGEGEGEGDVRIAGAEGEGEGEGAVASACADRAFDADTAALRAEFYACDEAWRAGGDVPGWECTTTCCATSVFRRAEYALNFRCDGPKPHGAGHGPWACGLCDDAECAMSVSFFVNGTEVANAEGVPNPLDTEECTYVGAWNYRISV